MRSWFRRQNSETDQKAPSVSAGSGRTGATTDVGHSRLGSADLGLRRNAPLHGSSASIAVDSGVAAAKAGRKSDVAVKRTSLILELETDALYRQQENNAGQLARFEYVLFSCFPAVNPNAGLFVIGCVMLNDL
jgi:hypothetical protein